MMLRRLIVNIRLAWWDRNNADLLARAERMYALRAAVGADCGYTKSIRDRLRAERAKIAEARAMGEYAEIQ